MTLLYDWARGLLFLLAVAGMILLTAGVMAGLFRVFGPEPVTQGALALIMLGGLAAAALATGALFWFAEHALFRYWPGEARRRDPFG